MEKLEGWAASGWRPCCGRCRAPVLDQQLPEGSTTRACTTCGASWSGAEASVEEAGFRVEQARQRAAARREWGPTGGKCEDCSRVGPRVEVPWVGITGTNEGKSVCLACAPPYVLDERSPTQSLEDGPVGLVVAVARRRMGQSPSGWLLGVAITMMILEDQQKREGIERVLKATLDNVFGAVTKVPS